MRPVEAQSMHAMRCGFWFFFSSRGPKKTRALRPTHSVRQRYGRDSVCHEAPIEASNYYLPKYLCNKQLKFSITGLRYSLGRLSIPCCSSSAIFVSLQHPQPNRTALTAYTFSNSTCYTAANPAKVLFEETPPSLTSGSSILMTSAPAG